MLNDDIIAYLTAKGVTFANGDFQTGIPEGGVDQIIHWDVEKLGPQPTDADLAAAAQQASEAAIKAENKKQAMERLQATDWTEMPSVSDPSITPHLTNKADFMAYRAQLRAIAVNPPINAVTIPVLPVEVWGG